MNIERQEDFESRFIKTNKDDSWNWKNIHFIDIIKWVDYYFEGKASSADGENRQVDAVVKPTLAELTEAIASKSYVANDVWDCTNECRRYQTTEVPVVEVKDVIEIIKSKCSL